MKNRKIIIGSRGSKLALIYAEKARKKILNRARDFGINEIIIKKIVTKGDQVLDKRVSEFGCLGADGFKEHLTSLNKKQIILTGVEAHICIFQSAVELKFAGFDVYVVIDAIASRDFTSYESALIRLKEANISLLNTESVLFEWLRDASHKKFKTISKLIS